MLKLNRKLEYAFIALQHMKGKNPGELTSANEIAEQFSIPFDATARVLQVMAQKGILRAEQGAQGGYQIIKDLRKVTLFDLMGMILGTVEMARCLSSEGCGIESTCNVRTPVRILESKLVEFYRNLSLSDLLNPGVTAKGEVSAIKNAGIFAAEQLENIL
jgi:Rrf2 family nitric oxide-sensitive transcriptional repressor